MTFPKYLSRIFNVCGFFFVKYSTASSAMTFPKFLRVVVSPQTSLSKLNETKIYSQTYFDAQFTKILSETLGFSYQLLSPRDGKIGTPLGNGSWTGLMGMVQRKEADLAVSAIAISWLGSRVVSFSYPFQISKYSFATRMPEYEPKPTAFLSPFSRDVWFLNLATFIIMPLALFAILKRRHPFYVFVWATFKTFIAQGPNIKPRKHRDYLIVTVWLLSTTFLVYCYEAVFLSFLTFPPMSGVRTVPELAAAVEQGKYQCTTYPGSFIIPVLQRSNDIYLKVIGQNLKEMERKGTFEIEDVLSLTKSSKKSAFIGAENHLIPWKEKYFCSNDVVFPLQLGIAIRKDFCCKTRLDRVISRIWAAGLYQKWLNDRVATAVIHNVFHVPDYISKNADRPLTILDFEGAFLILIYGYILSIFVFALEVLSLKLDAFLKGCSRRTTKL